MEKEWGDNALQFHFAHNKRYSTEIVEIVQPFIQNGVNLEA